MPRGKLRPTLEEVKALLAEDRDFLRPLVQGVVQELLEAEMSEALGAANGERTTARLGYRSGYYDRTLVSRVGKLELRVPQDRHGRFSTELFERYQRSEKALVAALAEMYVQGVSTRKVKAITARLAPSADLVAFDRASVGGLLCGNLPSFCPVFPRRLEFCLPHSNAGRSGCIFLADEAIRIAPEHHREPARDEPLRKALASNLAARDPPVVLSSLRTSHRTSSPARRSARASATYAPHGRRREGPPSQV